MLLSLCLCVGLSKVRWVGGDSHLLTIGAKDRSIFQWRHEVDDMAIADSLAKGGAAAVMKVGRYPPSQTLCTASGLGKTRPAVGLVDSIPPWRSG